MARGRPHTIRLAEGDRQEHLLRHSQAGPVPDTSGAGTMQRRPEGARDS